MKDIKDLRARADKKALEDLYSHVTSLNYYLDKCVGCAVALESTALMSQLGGVAEQIETLDRMMRQMQLDRDEPTTPAA